MKRFFLLFIPLLMMGCQEIDTELADIKARLIALEGTSIASILDQITSIQTTTKAVWAALLDTIKLTTLKVKGKIHAADKVAAEYKDQANKPIVVSVIFQPGNAMGEAEKKPIVIKSYTFKPVM